MTELTAAGPGPEDEITHEPGSHALRPPQSDGETFGGNASVTIMQKQPISGDCSGSQCFLVEVLPP